MNFNTTGSAEYILDVVGAGATAMAKADWHAIWRQSPEAHELLEELDLIRMSTIDRSVSGEPEPPKYATSWTYQLATLLQRDARTLWRDPTYLMAKMAVNVFCALVIGFTYWKSHSTIQGTQNKLFVGIHQSPCMSLLHTYWLSHQGQIMSFLDANSPNEKGQNTGGKKPKQQF